MIQRTAFFCFLLLTFSMSSCNNEVSEFKIQPATPRQALFSFLSDEMDTLRAYISQSVPIGSVESSGIENADLRLYEDDVLILNFESIGAGFYQSVKGEFEFKEGSDYYLKSTVPGLTDVSAKATLPSEIRFDTIEMVQIEGRLIDIYASFRDPVDIKNYYGTFTAKFYSNTVPVLEHYCSFSIRKNEPLSTLSDEGFDGKIIKVLLSCRFDQAVDLNNITKFNLTLNHIGKGSYDFQNNTLLNSFDAEEDFFTLFIPESLPSNVVGGYGFFGVANTETLEFEF